MLKIILLLLGNVVFNSAGNILMKVGMGRTEVLADDGEPLTGLQGIIHGFVLNPALIFGAFSYVASLAFYMFLLRKLDLSIAYPISVSCAIIIVTLVSGFALNEQISITQIIGMVIIMFGLFILTR